MAVNLIRRNNQPDVTAYQDTVIYNLIKGVNGVFPGIGNMFALSYNLTNMNLTIHSGMGMIYGRQFEIAEGEEIVWDWSALSGQKYISIYIEIDLRDSTSEIATFKSIYSDTWYPEITPGDNLIENNTGVARLLTHRVQRRQNGVVDIIPVYELFRTDWIKNADFATTSQHSQTSGNSEKVNDYQFGGGPNNAFAVKIPGSVYYNIIEYKQLLFRSNQGLTLSVSGTTSFEVSETINDGDVLDIYCSFLGIKHRIRVLAAFGVINISDVIGFAIIANPSSSASSHETTSCKALFKVYGGNIVLQGAWAATVTSNITIYTVHRVVGGNN